MSKSKCIRCNKIIPNGNAAMHLLSGSWHIHCNQSDIPERIFIQQYEDPEIEGFQEDDGAFLCPNLTIQTRK
jgi:hypothetical protein